MVHKLLAAAIGLLIISGCSGTRTDEILKNGNNIDSVRYALGLPLRGIVDLPNGNKMWTFGSSSSGMLPMTSPSTGTVVGPYGVATYNTSSTTWVPMNYSCTVQIEATSSGSIRHWQWQGNNCP